MGKQDIVWSLTSNESHLWYVFSSYDGRTPHQGNMPTPCPLPIFGAGFSSLPVIVKQFTSGDEELAKSPEIAPGREMEQAVLSHGLATRLVG